MGQAVAFLKQVRSGADSFAKEHELMQVRAASGIMRCELERE